MEQKKMTLRQLGKKLRQAELNDDPLTALVESLRNLSRWQNGDDFIKAFKEQNNNPVTLKKLKKLQIHFKQAGYDRKGFNWVKPGQRVTDKKVYLEYKDQKYDFILPKQSVDFWKKEKTGSGIYGIGAYNAICRQAKEVFKDYIVPIIKIIESIKKEDAAFIAV